MSTVIINAEWDPEDGETEPDINIDALMQAGLYDITVDVVTR